MNNIKKNVNKGFSLVELIVVIAIMAVLTAVLAPSLLAYVERSRAQKDDSAMAEVTNAIMLALADQNVYDEVLCYTCKVNVSCYVDQDSAAKIKTDATYNRVVTKDYDKNGDMDENQGAPAKWDQYTYNDNTRLQDEKEYVFAGNMRGVTITFRPEQNTNKSKFILSKGMVNRAGWSYKDSDLATEYGTTLSKAAAQPIYGDTIYGALAKTLGTMGSKDASTHNYLYNRVRATVGDEIELTSQTYRNSDYTVFIRMGTTGGGEANAQDAIMVYGQWNGTNLKFVPTT